MQRISQAKQRISQVTLPALQRWSISQAKQRISQVTLPALILVLGWILVTALVHFGGFGSNRFGLIGIRVTWG